MPLVAITYVGYLWFRFLELGVARMVVAEWPAWASLLCIFALIAFPRRHVHRLLVPLLLLFFVVYAHSITTPLLGAS